MTDPLSMFTPASTWRPPWRVVLSEVSEKRGVPVDWILSPRRRLAIVRARQEVMYRLYTETDLSLPAIGHRLYRDHSTIHYGVRQHEKRLRADRQAAE